jgi:hypothetical protein
MKIAFVALYLLNVNGGHPVLVTTYYRNAMAQCEASRVNSKPDRFNQFQLVCVPVYVPE